MDAISILDKHKSDPIMTESIICIPRAAYQKAIDDLKAQRAVAAEKLDALGEASADSWDDAKKGFSEAYKALYEAYKDALTNFE